MRTRRISYNAINTTNTSLLNFDFPKLIENMKLNYSFMKGSLNAKVLLKSPRKQIIITAVHGGTVIESNQTNESITIQILEGKIKFRTHNESVLLEKDQLLTLRENIKYSLFAKEETIFLLTIVCNTFQTVAN